MEVSAELNRALIFGGSPSSSSYYTEAWDGTSWTEVADMATGRGLMMVQDIKFKRFSLWWWRHNYFCSFNTEEWTTAPSNCDILTEGSIFLSGGTTLKGFGKAGGIPSASWALVVL